MGWSPGPWTKFALSTFVPQVSKRSSMLQLTRNPRPTYIHTCGISSFGGPMWWLANF